MAALIPRRNPATPIARRPRSTALGLNSHCTAFPLCRTGLPAGRLLMRPIYHRRPGKPAGGWRRHVAVPRNLTFERRIGRPALEALLRHLPCGPGWSRVGGQFVALVRRRDKLLLTTISQCSALTRADMNLFSTSLLAAVGAFPGSRSIPRALRARLNVTPIGDDTISKLKTLGPGGSWNSARRRASHAVAKPLPESVARMRSRSGSSAPLPDCRGRPAARQPLRRSVHCPLGGLDFPPRARRLALRRMPPAH